MTPAEKIKKILELKLCTDYSNRDIAEHVLGSRTKESTVRDILRRYNNKDPQGLGVEEDKSLESDTDNIKMLFIDIETSKILAYVWGLFKQNINISSVVEDWYIICYSAKWLGRDEVMNDSVHHHELPISGRYRDNEERLIRSAWNLLDEANYVVAYNGKRFDKKKLNAKFLQYGLKEPSPYKIIDPLLIVKGNFALTSAKLDWVTRLLGNDGKHTTNEQLWLDCMNDDVQALDYMQEYCDKDVIELEETYLKLRHWDKNTPNLALEFDDNKPRCNCCGSDKLTLVEDVYAKTTLSKFNVFRCERCGKTVRNRKNVLDTDKRKSLLMNIGG